MDGELTISVSGYVRVRILAVQVSLRALMICSELAPGLGLVLEEENLSLHILKDLCILATMKRL